MVLQVLTEKMQSAVAAAESAKVTYDTHGSHMEEIVRWAVTSLR